MTNIVSDHQQRSTNRFSVDSRVAIPSEVQILSRSQLLELINDADSAVTPNQDYSDGTWLDDGVLFTEATNLTSESHKEDPHLARDFSVLSKDENFRSFSSHHGFLSGTNTLQSVRIYGEEYVFEPISDWRYLVREIAFINALIDLCFDPDNTRVEDLMGGIYPPHRVAYSGLWLEEFNLELISPQTFFDVRPSDLVNKYGTRTSSGVVSIDLTGDKADLKELISRFEGVGHVRQYISDRITQAVKDDLQLSSLSATAHSASHTSTGLRAAIWLQAWEDLKRGGPVRQCVWCGEDYFTGPTLKRFCSSTCRQRSGRAGKK